MMEVLTPRREFTAKSTNFLVDAALPPATDRIRVIVDPDTVDGTDPTLTMTVTVYGKDDTVIATASLAGGPDTAEGPRWPFEMTVSNPHPGTPMRAVLTNGNKPFQARLAAQTVAVDEALPPAADIRRRG